MHHKYLGQPLNDVNDSISFLLWQTSQHEQNKLLERLGFLNKHKKPLWFRHRKKEGRKQNQDWLTLFFLFTFSLIRVYSSQVNNNQL